MTSRAHWNLPFMIMLLSGCQSAQNYLPWQTAGQPRYTAEELALLSEPQAAAAEPALAASMNASSATPIQTVSATSPVAAGRVEQLIKSGQNAIRAAGQGDFEKLAEARQIFDQVLVMDPANSSAHHGIAIVADLQQDWPTAEMHYKQALQERNGDPSLLNDLGYSYLLQNRFHEASQYLSQAIQISPQHERAHINLALLSLKRGDRQGAETRLAAIYSPAEINSTLARLEQDVRQSASVTNTMVAATGQPVSGQTMPSNFSPAQPMTSGNVRGQTEQPVHVYPPGVIPQPETALRPPQMAQAQGIYGNPNMPQYGGNGDHGNNSANPGQPAMQLPFHAVNQSQQIPSGSYQNQTGSTSGYPNPPGGLPVGGIIAQPTAAGQQYYPGAANTPSIPQNQGHQTGTAQRLIQHGSPQPVQAVTYPGTNSYQQNGAGQAASDYQAPIAGLNAGPGTLFPMNAGYPGPSGAAPTSQYPTAQQSTSAYPGQQGYPQMMPGQPGAGYPNAGGGSAADSRPISVLPGEQQLQQQMQYGHPPLQVQNSQRPPVSTVSGARYSPAPSGGGMVYGPDNGFSSSGQQVHGNGAANQSGYPGYPQAPVYGNNQTAAPGTNPLTAYEQQLQQLDNQYNQAIQQMDGSGNRMQAMPQGY